MNLISVEFELSSNDHCSSIYDSLPLGVAGGGETRKLKTLPSVNNWGVSLSLRTLYIRGPSFHFRLCLPLL